MPGVGEMYVEVKPRTTGFVGALDRDLNAAADRASASFGKRMAAGMDKAGKTMTRHVTLPIVAAGGASIYLAAQFETAMSKMVGLAGVPRAEIDKLKQGVLDLAGKTAQSPIELAEALYFITSSGQTGAQAMDTLTISAKAAASGLGETQTVADAITSVMAAYGAENINAARTADILTASVKFGKAEASELSEGIGNLAPLAAQLGVGFDQLGASIAAMTMVGVDTDTAFTNMSAIFSGLLKATPQMEEQLAAVGLSAEGLRETIKQPKGLLTALREIDTAFGGNEAAIAEVFPNIRALRGVMALLAQNGEQVDKVFQGVADSTGDAGFAFKTAAQTSAFQFEQALAKLQVAAIEVGNALLPVAGKIVDAIGDIATAFSALPGSSQDFLLIAAAATAALGPLLRVGAAAVKLGQVMGQGGFTGNLAKAGTSLGIFAAGVGLLKPQLDELAVPAELSGAAIGALTGIPFGPWGAAVGGVLGGIAGAFGLMGDSATAQAQAVEEAQARIDAAVSTTAEKLAVAGGVWTGQTLQDVAKQLGVYDELSNKLGKVGVSYDQMALLINAKGPQAIQNTGELAETFGLTVDEANSLLSVTSKWGLALDDANAKAVNQGVALGNLGAAERVVAQEFANAESHLARLAGTQAGLNLSLNDANDILGPVIGQARAHAEAILAQTGSAEAANLTMIAYRQRMIDALTPVTQNADAAAALVDALLAIEPPPPIPITAEDKTAPPFSLALGRVDNWTGQNPRTGIHADDRSSAGFDPAKAKAMGWSTYNPRTGIHADDNTPGPFAAAQGRAGAWRGESPRTGVWADDFASPTLWAVKGAADAIPDSKVITVTTRDYASAELNRLKELAGAQHGGPVSGLTMVGEAGPELALFPKGSRVVTAQETARYMRAIASAAGTRKATGTPVGVSGAGGTIDASSLHLAARELIAAAAVLADSAPTGMAASAFQNGIT